MVYPDQATKVIDWLVQKLGTLKPEAQAKAVTTLERLVYFKWLCDHGTATEQIRAHIANSLKEIEA